MTRIQYWQHPQATTWADAYIVTIGIDEIGSWVELSDTIAHVRGGGQLGDRGTIGAMSLLDVRRSKETKAIRHYVDSISGVREGEDVTISINADWRRLNSVLHSAGHLLAGVVESLYPSVKATNAHHYPGEARVDFTACPEAAIEIDAVNARIADELRNHQPTSTFVHPDGTRYVKIGHFPSVGCGGTHVMSTAEFSAVTATKISQKNGVLRISYDAS